VNDELEGIRKDAVLAQFKVLSRNLPEGTENHEKLSHNSQSPGLDLNLGPPEHVAG
jgi:hypothetical protein